jgi:hypothetical protein
MLGQFRVINPFRDRKKGDLPSDPRVILTLGQWGIRDESVIFSGSLGSDSEIDFAIEKLKQDIEAVRKSAKRTLKLPREKFVLQLRRDS